MVRSVKENLSIPDSSRVYSADVLIPEFWAYSKPKLKPSTNIKFNKCCNDHLLYCSKPTVRTSRDMIDCNNFALIKHNAAKNTYSILLYFILHMQMALSFVGWGLTALSAKKRPYHACEGYL